MARGCSATADVQRYLVHVVPVQLDALPRYVVQMRRPYLGVAVVSHLANGAMHMHAEARR